MGKRVVGVNDLASLFPEVAAEWHPTKNGELTPKQVTIGSGKRVWWFGKCNHAWEARVITRTNGAGCPICSGRQVLVGFNDLATKNPELAAEWHPTKNGELTPEKISAGTHTKIWWLGVCHHEWEATPDSRSRSGRGRGCPICSGNKILSGFNDLATKNPELAAEWHPTKNGELTTEQITVASGRKVWWLGKCGHEWEAKPNTRTSNSSGCAVCSGNKILSGFNDLVTKNPKLAAEWHPTKNGELIPTKVGPSSNMKVWWVGYCGHSWETTPLNRRHGTLGCPICSGFTLLSGFNDLATKNPELAAEWHPTKNGIISAREINAGTNQKVWWQCKKGHEWGATVSSRSTGVGCPQCWATTYISKAEQEVHDYIVLLLDEDTPLIQSDKKLLKGKELDIYIPSKAVAIEFNGVHWHKEKFVGKQSHYNKYLAAKKCWYPPHPNLGG